VACQGQPTDSVIITHLDDGSMQGLRGPELSVTRGVAAWTLHRGGGGGDATSGLKTLGGGLVVVDRAGDGFTKVGSEKVCPPDTLRSSKPRDGAPASRRVRPSRSAPKSRHVARTSPHHNRWRVGPSIIIAARLAFARRRACSRRKASLVRGVDDIGLLAKSAQWIWASDSSGTHVRRAACGHQTVGGS